MFTIRKDSSPFVTVVPYYLNQKEDHKGILRLLFLVTILRFYSLPCDTVYSGTYVKENLVLTYIL